MTHPPADEERRIATYGKTSTGDSFYGLLGYQFWTDDVHPCYLPDGGLCFASTRCEHGVLCTPLHYLACTNLFRMDADGSGLRPLSRGALSEFTPTMMEDGRILYNRWEYVYKGIAAVQPLWIMRPDGSGSEEFYGDNIANPGVFWQARQVPGHPRLAVCIGCGHEPLGVGQVLLLDLNKDKRTPEPMTSLTPNVKTAEPPRPVPAPQRRVARGHLRPVLRRSLSAVRQVLPRLLQSGPALQRPGGLRHLPAGRLRQPRADLPRSGDLLLAADAAAAAPDAARAARA